MAEKYSQDQQLDLLEQLMSNPELFASNYVNQPPKFLYHDDDLCHGHGNKEITKVTQLSLTYRKDSPAGLATGLCGYYNCQELSYLGGDEFTNEMIINLILMQWWEDWQRENQANFNPLRRYRGSSICDQRGIHVFERSQCLSLLDLARLPDYSLFRDVKKYDDLVIESVKPNIIKEIIGQVVFTLDLLQKDLLFNHGYLTTEAVKVCLDDEMTIEIGRTSKASLTLETSTGPVRIYNKTWLADRYLYTKPINSHLNTREDFYILDNFLTPHLYTRSREMGIPFYLSFDLYTFIISLLLIPNYYYSFFDDKNLVESIWNKLWFDQDGHDVKRLIKGYLGRDYDDKTQLSLIIDIVRGKRLKCHPNDPILRSLEINKVS